VSIVQVPVFKHTSNSGTYHTLRHACDASGARRLIDGSGASKRSPRHGGSKLYYVMLHWPGSNASYLGRPEMPETISLMNNKQNKT